MVAPTHLSSAGVQAAVDEEGLAGHVAVAEHGHRQVGDLVGVGRRDSTNGDAGPTPAQWPPAGRVVHAGAVSGFDGRAYQAKFDQLAEEGVDVHGEARLILSLLEGAPQPPSVLDAGCGTGRVATELARRGVEVVGVDVDASMIGEARRRQPALEWLHADLASLSLGRRFSVVALAGNVPLFCPPADRRALVASCAAHLAGGGIMVAGFQLDGRYSLEEWDEACADAGLVLTERWATWDRTPWTPGADYAVSVHRPGRR